MSTFTEGQIISNQERIERKLDALLAHLNIEVEPIPEHPRPYVSPYDHNCGCNDGSDGSSVNAQ